MSGFIPLKHQKDVKHQEDVKSQITDEKPSEFTEEQTNKAIFKYISTCLKIFKNSKDNTLKPKDLKHIYYILYQIKTTNVSHDKDLYFIKDYIRENIKESVLNNATYSIFQAYLAYLGAS